jgi:hypothetical protein
VAGVSVAASVAAETRQMAEKAQMRRRAEAMDMMMAP